jgi:hypothetical protein
LDKIDLISTESSQVGNIENAIIGLSMLTMDSSNLDVVFVSDLLMLFRVLHKLGKVDMDGSSKTSSHVGGASSNVSEMLIISKFSLLLDLVGSGSKSLENLSNV